MKRTAQGPLEKQENKRTRKISDFFVDKNAKKRIILAIVGGRDFKDYNLLCNEVDHIKNNFIITDIVSGGAKGADTLARRYALENKIEMTELKPDWVKYGIGAGKNRNTDIVMMANYIVAFWDGKSQGTKDTIRKSRRFGKELKIVHYKIDPVVGTQ